jgi:hypothetical protein
MASADRATRGTATGRAIVCAQWTRNFASGSNGPCATAASISRTRPRSRDSMGRRRHRHPRPPGRRAALTLLADAGAKGCDTAALVAIGFATIDLYGLVREGLASANAERSTAQGRVFDLSRLRITEAGREMLAKATAASAPTRGCVAP